MIGLNAAEQANLCSLLQKLGTHLDQPVRPSRTVNAAPAKAGRASAKRSHQ
jgi:hypothetical protein